MLSYSEVNLEEDNPTHKPCLNQGFQLMYHQ
jgi:hypothetical protein